VVVPAVVAFAKFVVLSVVPSVVPNVVVPLLHPIVVELSVVPNVVVLLSVAKVVVPNVVPLVVQKLVPSVVPGVVPNVVVPLVEPMVVVLLFSGGFVVGDMKPVVVLDPEFVVNMKSVVVFPTTSVPVVVFGMKVVAFPNMTPVVVSKVVLPVVIMLVVRVVPIVDDPKVEFPEVNGMVVVDGAAH